jgi:hypothetical protein
MEVIQSLLADLTKLILWTYGVQVLLSLVPLMFDWRLSSKFDNESKYNWWKPSQTCEQMVVGSKILENFDCKCFHLPLIIIFNIF